MIRVIVAVLGFGVFLVCGGMRNDWDQGVQTVDWIGGASLVAMLLALGG